MTENACGSPNLMASSRSRSTGRPSATRSTRGWSPSYMPCARNSNVTLARRSSPEGLTECSPAERTSPSYANAAATTRWRESTCGYSTVFVRYRCRRSPPSTGMHLAAAPNSPTHATCASPPRGRPSGSRSRGWESSPVRVQPTGWCDSSGKALPSKYFSRVCSSPRSGLSSLASCIRSSNRTSCSRPPVNSLLRC